MYGLPPDIDLSFFNEQILFQICIGANDLILNFDDNISVTVTSAIGCADSSGSIHDYVDFRQAAPAIMGLIEQKVVTADGDRAGTLTLKFDGGGVLAIYDDSKEYESYTIKNGDMLIVV